MSIFNKKPTEVISTWSKLIENFAASPSEFYGLVESGLAVRQVPKLEVSRVEFLEGGLLSAKREYLRLTRERIVFDICAAPFGTGFFVSSRFSQIPLRINPLAVVLLILMLGVLLMVFDRLFNGLIPGFLVLALVVVAAVWFLRNAVALGLKDVDDALLKSPLVGTLYEMYFRRMTYYRIDTMRMYQAAVHSAVLEAVATITAGKGVRAVSGVDDKPVMTELLG